MLNKETATIHISADLDGKPRVSVSIEEIGDDTMVDEKALATRAANAYLLALEKLPAPKVEESITQ